MELDLSGLRIGPDWVRQNCRLIANFCAEMGHPIKGRTRKERAPDAAVDVDAGSLDDGLVKQSAVSTEKAATA